MRRIIVGLSIILALLGIAPAANAQLGYLLAYTLGASSASGTQSPASMGNVIYAAPRIGDRVKDPLTVRFVTTGAVDLHRDVEEVKKVKKVKKNYTNLQVFVKGKTLHEIFAQLVKTPEKYTILEASRFIMPNASFEAMFSFAYIETDKLVPLGDLKPLP